MPGGNDGQHDIGPDGHRVETAIGLHDGAGSTESPMLLSATILIVDDIPINHDIIGAYLAAEGYTNLVFANDGDSALTRIKCGGIDLVILDLAMPRMDGYAVCRTLRSNARFRDIPVIVQTMLDQPEQRSMAFAVGATDLVTKPLNRTELLARVGIHLRQQRLIRDLRQYRERISQDLALARDMQHDLLPRRDSLRAIGAETGIHVCGAFEPSTELGGDLWGVRKISSAELAVFMVDFSGHGISSALNTFRLHALLNRDQGLDRDPSSLLERINHVLCAMLSPPHFAAMLYGIVDVRSRTFRYAACASIAPLLLIHAKDDPSGSHSGEDEIGIAHRWGDGSGLPLGIARDAVYETRSLPLPPTGLLMLVSDALVDHPDTMTAEDDPSPSEADLGLMDQAPPLRHLAAVAKTLVREGGSIGRPANAPIDPSEAVQRLPAQLLNRFRSDAGHRISDDATVIAIACP